MCDDRELIKAFFIFSSFFLRTVPEMRVGSKAQSAREKPLRGGRVVMLRRLAHDPGVREELSSWRWKSIYYLSAVYAMVGAVWLQSSGIVPEIRAENGKDLTAVPVEKRLAPTLSTEDIVKLYPMNDVYECGRKNAQFALTQLLKFRGEFEDKKPPLVVGGIGDSGTRAIAYLTTQLGVWMGKFGVTVKKDSRDSKLFINGFETLTCDADQKALQSTIKSYVFYSRSIQSCKSADYHYDCVNDKRIWNIGVQWTSALFRTLLNHTVVYTSRKANQEQFAFGLWGFKHPRSSFVLPYISHVTNNRFRYVHVMRDGRDIAAGDNQYFFNSVCKRYHTPDSPLCEDVYENRVELWSRLNLDVLEWARRNLAPEQFMVLRIEDLVNGDKACFEKLARFTRTSARRAKEVVRASVRLFTVKQERYFGRKYTPEDREAHTNAVKSRPWSVKAFRTFGYDIENWGTTGSCSEQAFLAPTPVENSATVSQM